AAGRHAGLNRQRMLAQVLALCPFGEQLPGLLAPIGRSIAGVHIFSMLIHMVRVSSGLFGNDGEILGLSLSFYLTIMVHFPESYLYRGVRKAPWRASSGAPHTAHGHHSSQRGDTRG